MIFFSPTSLGGSEGFIKIKRIMIYFKVLVSNQEKFVSYS